MKVLEYREVSKKKKKNLLFKIHNVNPTIIITIESSQLQRNSYWNMPIWRCPQGKISTIHSKRNS